MTVIYIYSNFYVHDHVHPLFLVTLLRLQSVSYPVGSHHTHPSANVVAARQTLVSLDVNSHKIHLPPTKKFTIIIGFCDIFHSFPFTALQEQYNSCICWNLGQSHREGNIFSLNTVFYTCHCHYHSIESRLHVQFIVFSKSFFNEATSDLSLTITG